MIAPNITEITRQMTMMIHEATSVELLVVVEVPEDDDPVILVQVPEVDTTQVRSALL